MRHADDTLDTARLHLVAVEPGHLDLYRSLYGDPTVMRHIAEPLDDAAIERILRGHVDHWAFHDFGGWCMWERSSGSFVGIAGLKRPDGSDEVEMGWILHPRVRGQGFASKAAQAVLAFGLERARVDSIVARIAPGNGASIAVALRLGMQQVPGSPDGAPLVFRSTRRSGGAGVSPRS